MNDLTLITETAKALLGDKVETFLPMLEVISANTPLINQGMENFGKSQSQFMDNMLTVAHPTPIRNLRQILSQINQTRQALRENYYKVRRTEVEIKQLKAKLFTITDPFEQELLSIDIEDKESSLEVTSLYVGGAIKKLTNYIEQYNSILASIGVKTFDEIDFEAEEERYHIMTAFAQALTAARSHGGIVDEGNHIYFYQIGINGMSAQNDISSLLREEGGKIQAGQEPGHEMVLEFLNRMAEKFKGCSTTYAKKKGQTGIITEMAAIMNDEKKAIPGAERHEAER